MKKILLFVNLLLWIVSPAQVIVTLQSKYLGNLLNLDSIIVENLTQPSHLSMAAPPEINSYVIDLMLGKIINAIPEINYKGTGLQEVINKPGRLQVSATLIKQEILSVSLLNVTGEIVQLWNIECGSGISMLDISAGSGQMYICTIAGEKIKGSFKIVGNGDNPIGLTVTQGIKAENEYLSRYKSNSEFVFAPGDGVRFTAFKNGMYRNSITSKPQNLDSVLIYLSIPCPDAPQVTDYDGNIYNTVLIGTQCWMKENIRSKHYADGAILADGTGVGDITSDYHAKYWFDYNDNPNFSDTYGRLYTAAAATNELFAYNSQGICPNGWHVSMATEWCQMEMLLDSTIEHCKSGPGSAGGWMGNYLHAKLCETDTTHWAAPFHGIESWATDESGFNALPSGARSGYLNASYFYGINFSTQWWAIGPTNGGIWDYGTQPMRGLTFLDYGIFRTWTDSYEGLSVRCVKN